MRIIECGFTKQAAILRDTLQERLGKLPEDLTVTLKADPGIGAPESFMICGEKNAWTITGADLLGVSFGIGKFLHAADYKDGGFAPKATDGCISPHSPLRAMYAASHFYNWYQQAPDDEMEKYLTELLLWGYNTIFLHMPVIMCDYAGDETFQMFSRIMNRLFGIARSLGMHTALVQTPNTGAKDAPKEYYSDLSFNRPTRGTAGILVCPSRQGGLAYLKKVWRKVFETFAEVGIDYYVAFPYDEGGCGCELCRPWGAKGFPNMNMELRKIAKEYFPDIKIALGTWAFDEPDNQGEYEGMYQRIAAGEIDCEYLMIDSHTDFPEYALTHAPVRPVIDFPEISMWGLFPWGGYGANPMPRRFQRIWDSQKHLVKGGLPYSEGIFEDISKVQFAGYYWDPDRDWKDIFREYISYEIDACETERILSMIENIEDNAVAVGEVREPNLAKAVANAALARAIDGNLPERAKKAWRWRYLYIRAILDEKRYRAYFAGEEERMEEGLHILRRSSGEYLRGDEEAQTLLLELIAFDHAVPDNGRNRWTLPPAEGYAVFRN